MPDSNTVAIGARQNDGNEIKTLSYNNTNTLTLSDGGGSLVVPRKAGFVARRSANITMGNGAWFYFNA
jgi:type 1 fimbria pilin